MIYSLLFIKDECSGASDAYLLEMYLNKNTTLLTKDKKFHNTVVSKGMNSYCAMDGDFTRKVILKNKIGTNPDITPVSPEEPMDEETTRIRNCIIPGSPKALKKLRSRRRRIKNYFQGLGNIEGAGLWLSILPLKKGAMLIGIRLKLFSPKTKSLDASESYLKEVLRPEERSTAALCHTLIKLLRLKLNRVPIILYYDGTLINKSRVSPGEFPNNGLDCFYRDLCGTFSRLTFEKTGDTRFMKMLKTKLQDLKTTRCTNEIIDGGLKGMLARYDADLPF